VINFYLSALGLVALALIFVIYPVVRAKQKDKVHVSNANVVKQRISELEREVEEGLIDADDKEQAIQDLKIALVDETPESATNAGKLSAQVMVLLAIPAVLLGAWVYWQSNQLGGLYEYKQAKTEVVALRERMQESGGQGLTPNDFAVLALSIRSSLRDNPDDATGWGTLGLISSAIGRVDESVAAYEKAIDLNPGDDDLRFKYAETLMLSGSEDHLATAKRQLDYLLGKEPSNRNYRLLLTTVAIKQQDAEVANKHFSFIKDQLDPSSQFYLSIVNELAKLGVNVVPGEQASASLGENTFANNSSALNVTVNIDDALKSKLPKNAYLIVFAQNSEGASKAPLAVKRLILDTLPVVVNLSDQDAMIPSMNLSSAKTVKLTARISIDENVMPQAGELEGSINDIKITSGAVESFVVTINKEI